MDWKLAMEAERAALMRVAALLLALADLAELASSRSQAVRGLVLWILCPAEAVARNLVTGSPGQIPLCQAGGSPADAIRLASGLRSLAAAFRGLSRGACLCVDDIYGLPADAPASRSPTSAGGFCSLARTLAEASLTALHACRGKPYDTS